MVSGIEPMAVIRPWTADRHNLHGNGLDGPVGPVVHDRDEGS
jgi:hypothetical protein